MTLSKILSNSNPSIRWVFHSANPAKVLVAPTSVHQGRNTLHGGPPHGTVDHVAATRRLARVGSSVAFAAALISLIACGGRGSTTAPSPVPDPAVSGRIENLETVADLITYNQNVNVGLSIPGEGVIQRSAGIITRWELPIPVYVDASIGGTNVAEALNCTGNQ